MKWISFLASHQFHSCQPTISFLASQRFHSLPAIDFIPCQPAISFLASQQFCYCDSPSCPSHMCDNESHMGHHICHICVTMSHIWVITYVTYGCNMCHTFVTASHKGLLRFCVTLCNWNSGKFFKSKFELCH